MSTIAYRLALKRCIDFAVALIGLVVLSPIVGLIALAIKLESPRDPIFFNDFVMGQRETKFKLFKFRTMVPHEIDYLNRSEVYLGDPRVTRVGAVLRRTLLDELPQLLNVLVGEMNLVGPRPMDPYRFARATEFQRQRCLVRPGMTGWAAVNGNTLWSWEERIEMDIWYIANWSLSLDMKILLKTIPLIVFGQRKKDLIHGRITDHKYRIKWPGQALRAQEVIFAQVKSDSQYGPQKNHVTLEHERDSITTKGEQ